MTKYCYFVQPIENIRSKKIIMYELLLRMWDETAKSWVVPSNFEISVETMISLLEAVHHTLGDNHISINLSNKQFSDLKVAHELIDYARQHLRPRQLTIELVETPEIEVLKIISEAYRGAGILLAIDDVGSDNLYVDIKEMLPYVNTIKFALQNLRKFNEQTTPEQIEMLRFWFNKSEEEQMLFTFEGIENDADLKLASRVGITRGQGYYFSRPLEVSEAVAQERRKMEVNN